MNVPLSLYIHFPWCVAKCPYCDFNSHALSDGAIPESGYITALISDLDRDLGDFNIPKSTPLHSIFMGGGTPSLFSGGAIQNLLDQIRERLTLTEITEVTLEANPGTVDGDNFKGYRAAGINRLSLGVQSFGTQQLKSLGRIHTADEASQAFSTAREAGFDNINLDLMHGLPQQNTEGALADLQTAINLQPEHISWYQLTIEPNTVFYNKPPSIPADDDLWQIYEEGSLLLKKSGYERYEVSAFSRPGKRSRHNTNYWSFGDYIGIGAGAHGKLTKSENDQLVIVRTNKTRLPSDYLNQQKSKLQTVEQNERPIEFLMNGLRLVDGFEPVIFEERTGIPANILDGFLKQATEKGLISREANIAPTKTGLQYLNNLLIMATEI